VDLLDPQKQLDIVEQTKPRLLEDTVWYLGELANPSWRILGHDPNTRWITLGLHGRARHPKIRSEHGRIRHDSPPDQRRGGGG